MLENENIVIGLEELSNNLNLLKNNEKVKFNVFFIIPEPLNSFCYKINQEINKCNLGLLKFGSNSIAMPHISILMGYVNSEQMLLHVLEEISEFSNTISPFRLDPTNLYFKSFNEASSKYLFIDFLQNDFLVKQKHILDKRLYNEIISIGWNMKDERAHISVGCFKHLTPAMSDIIDSYKQIPPCEITQLGVSLVGKHGMTLGCMKVFNLKRK